MGFLTRTIGKWSVLSRFLGDEVKAADRQRIIRGTLQSFLIQGVSILLVFASNIWLVRSSNPDAYGLYVHVFNWVSLLSVFVLAGRDDLVLALIPRYAGEGDPHRITRLVKACNRWLFLATLLFCGLFLLVISLFPIKALSEHRSLFLLSVAAVYLTAYMGLNQPVLQALNHIRLSQVVEKIARPLLLLCGVGMLRWTATSFSVRHLVILASLVLCLCGVIIFITLKRQLRKMEGESPAVGPAAGPGEAFSPGPDRSRSFGSGGDPQLSGKVFYFFCISLLTLLSTRIVMLLLPYFNTPTKDIGIFNVCTRYADLLIFPFFLMHTVLPQLFARHTASEKNYTQALFNESNRLMSFLCLPLLLVNIIAGRLFLSWFGHDFIPGYTALVYISIAQSLFSFFGPANTILMMQDREKYSASCLLVYVLLLVVTCCIFIPKMGATGGALAILSSSLLYNMLLAVVTYRTTGIRSPYFSFLIRRR